MAAARPMPRLPPVITTTLSVTSPPQPCTGIQLLAFALKCRQSIQHGFIRQAHQIVQNEGSEEQNQAPSNKADSLTLPAAYRDRKEKENNSDHQEWQHRNQRMRKRRLLHRSLPQRSST